MLWAEVGANGDQVLRRGSSADGPIPATAAERTVLVLPGVDAQVKTVALPAQSEAQARKAAALMFEGALVAAEGVHYAVGAPIDADGTRLVAAMDRPRLQAFLDRARSLGADPRQVTVDFLAWPSAPGDIDIVETASSVIVAGGARGGFAIEPAVAPALFGRWLSQTGGQGAPIRLYGGDPGAWGTRLGAAAALLRPEPAGDMFARLVLGATDLPPFAPNLRQGLYAEQERAGRGQFWGFAIALGLLAVALQIGVLVVTGLRDHSAAKALQAEAETAFRAARPEVQRIVDLPAQVAAARNAQRASQTHPVLAAGPAIRDALAAQPDARLDDLRHEGEGRTLRLVLSATGPGALEATTQALRGKGLEVTSRSMAPQGGRYVAELDLEAPL
jgi:type II secretion system protein L